MSKNAENIQTDMYAEDSIELLRNCGINFERHQIEGIDTSWFAEMLITSGIVLMNRVNWITFHSGYDFCYLLKVNLKFQEFFFAFFLSKMTFISKYSFNCT